jgi:SAM-dependent MidA family methyltransferase
MSERFQVGLRRVPELDLDAPLPASDPGLVERIRTEISERGPMPFARFMELALYDPHGGYYTGDRDAPAGPGRDGDFLTAPEGHPIFGWTLARELERTWQLVDRPARFVVREHGAGSGALAAGILDGLRRSRSPLLEAIAYQAIEPSRGRRDRLVARLQRLGLADRLEEPTDRPEAGAVLANELLDALPVHLVSGGPNGDLLERFVTAAAAGPRADRPFVLQPGPPSTPALAARLAGEGVVLRPGQEAEICLALDAWLARAAASLARGLVLLIDYGAPADRLYDPARGGTLRAYHRHRVHADPLVAIGRQDLTAHVDLTAVGRAASAIGLDSLAVTSQAELLAELGAGELLVGLQSDPTMTMGRYLAARSALMRMLDPRVTGGFAVLRFGRQLPGEAVRRSAAIE